MSVISLFHLFPNIFSCFRMGGIIEVNIKSLFCLIIHKVHVGRRSAFVVDDIAFMPHLAIIVTETTDCRPYGHHGSHTQALQCLCHLTGIRPAFWIKLPLTMPSPMEKVNYYHR